MEFLYDMWDRFREWRWWQQGLAIAALLFLFTVFIDVVLMPIYTRHGDELEVPPVVAMAEASARETLVSRGLEPEILESVFDTMSAGSVVRQNPHPGMTVKEGRRVYLVISKGPKPRYMPNLIKESLRNAQLRIREAGLRLNHVNYEHSSAVPLRDVVIFQSISPGSPITSGNYVNLTVSLGPPPSSNKMPNLVGQILDAGLKELSAVGIDRNRVSTRVVYRPNLIPQTIVSQSKPAGTPAGDIQELELVISTDQLPQGN